MLSEIASHLFSQLETHYQDIQACHMRDWFRTDPDRAVRYSLSAPYLFLDYSKNRIQDETLDLLLQLAKASRLEERIEELFCGAALNNTECRPALHTALRMPQNESLIVNGSDIGAQIHDTKRRMGELVNAFHEERLLGHSGKKINTLVSIGIGGSYLGPKMITQALAPYSIDGVRVLYISNIDGADLDGVMSDISPEETVFLIQSKSFTTLETLENAKAVKAFLRHRGWEDQDISKHLLAATSNIEKAVEFGIEKDRILPMWDWVGGRYSLWSAIGLPIMFQVGPANFDALLKGANDMDNHFRTQPLDQNMPVILALIGIWYSNFFGASTHAVLPYDHSLRDLPSHLQQLDMESNGKSVDRAGQPLAFNSGPVVWGGAGTNGQHAYHQLMHQGTHLIPADFIIPMQSHFRISNHHTHLVSNCLSQSQAMMQGLTIEEVKSQMIANGASQCEAERLAPHKIIAGNKPNNVIALQQLTPESLGALVAMYEHKVFVQGVIWDINSFDQWGVELGKALSSKLTQALVNPNATPECDSSTAQLIRFFQQASDGHA